MPPGGIGALFRDKLVPDSVRPTSVHNGERMRRLA
jgi:hypothetical protein